MTVFIPNRSAHDFSNARRFGNFIFLTDGMVDRYQVNTIYRKVIDCMSEATADDYLLISSLSIISSIASAVLARRFGRVNYLLFQNGFYVERTIEVDALLTD